MYTIGYGSLFGTTSIHDQDADIDIDDSDIMTPVTLHDVTLTTIMTNPTEFTPNDEMNPTNYPPLKVLQDESFRLIISLFLKCKSTCYVYWKNHIL